MHRPVDWLVCEAKRIGTGSIGCLVVVQKMAAVVFKMADGAGYLTAQVSFNIPQRKGVVGTLQKFIR